jgi:hypothetical protein
MTAPVFSTAASPAPERLIGGDTMPRVAREVVVPASQTIVPGLLMGRITANGQWIRSLAAAVDGSQVPRGVAMTTVTTTANTEVPIFVTGEFAEAQIVLGVGHTLASVREGLADLNIYLRASVAE